MELDRYTVAQWGCLCGATEEEVREAHGKDVIEFYAVADRPLAGCKHSNGAFDLFGCGYDMNNIRYEEMRSYIMLID